MGLMSKTFNNVQAHRKVLFRNVCENPMVNLTNKPVIVRRSFCKGYNFQRGSHTNETLYVSKLLSVFELLSSFIPNGLGMTPSKKQFLIFDPKSRFAKLGFQYND